MMVLDFLLFFDRLCPNVHFLSFFRANFIELIKLNLH